MIFLYLLVALISFWTRYPNLHKFLYDMIIPTYVLIFLPSAINLTFKRQKPVTSTNDTSLYYKLAKILSYLLAIPFVLFGILTFFMMSIEREFIAGLVMLIFYTLISIFFFSLPWGLYRIIRYIKRKLTKSSNSSVQSFKQSEAIEESQERKRIKKLAIRLAILVIITVSVLCVYLVLSGAFSLRVVLISAPFSLLIGLFFPALMYFWKGSIK